MHRLVMLVLFFQSQPGTPVTDQRAILEHVRVAYAANRASFAAGMFEFDYTKGASASEDDARQGQFKVSATARGRYNFDGEWSRYEILYSTEDMKRMSRETGATTTMSLIRSFRMVSDGRIALNDDLSPDGRDDAASHLTQIVPASEVLSHCEFPIQLGNPFSKSFDLANDIGSIVKKETELIALNSRARLSGRNVLEIELMARNGKRTYWVDLERGALPLRARDEVTGGGTIQMDLDDIRFEEGHGWLPRTMTVCENGGQFATRILIREATFEPPPRSSFRLEFKEAMGIEDRTRNRYYSKPQKVWDLANLPGANSKDSRPTDIGYVAPAPAKRGEIQSGWPAWRIALTAVASAGLVLTVAWIIRARRRA